MEEDQRPRVEVCFTPDKFEQYYREGSSVVVIDVLRATTAICTAFENGVDKIIPVSSLAEAEEYNRMGYLVGAERGGQIVDGFHLGNSPYDYMGDNIRGKTVVLTTTNGTRAINIASVSDRVYIGSLTNMDAIIDRLLQEERSCLMLGSGWKNKFNLEDSICAGGIAEALILSGKFRSEHDSTIAARYLYKSARDQYFGFLKSSSHRRRLKRLNLNRDIKYCLTPNQTRVIPFLKDGELLLLQ